MVPLNMTTPGVETSLRWRRETRTDHFASIVSKTERGFAIRGAVFGGHALPALRRAIPASVAKANTAPQYAWTPDQKFEGHYVVSRSVRLGILSLVLETSGFALRPATWLGSIHVKDLAPRVAAREWN
jgi:hypothetical protein